MDMLIILIKLPHCTLSTYTITFVNYFSITLVEGRGRVWEVFLYFELGKHSIIVWSSWRGRFQVSIKKKSKGKSSEAGSVIREWKKLSGLRWTALKGYTWKKQKKEDRAVITQEIRTMVCKKKKNDFWTDCEGRHLQQQRRGKKDTNLRKQRATYSINKRVGTEFLKMWWKVSRNGDNLKRWSGAAWNNVLF